MSHLQKIQILFNQVCQVLEVQELSFRPMKGRQRAVNIVRRQNKDNEGLSRNVLAPHILGYLDLKRKIVTIDIWTPRRRQPKSYNSLLRIMAHEIAHCEKPPYRQRYKGRLIMRRHYPEFYKQVNKNIEVFKGDKVLGRYFRSIKSLNS